MNIVLGISLIVVPIFFNWAFASLAKQFEYPDILRKPTAEVLAKFKEGGTKLVLTWWLFALSAVLFGAIAVSVPVLFPGLANWQSQLIIVFGLLASLVQFLGLIRWPFLVPYLAREAENASAEKISAIDVIFQSFNRYLGVAVGEHLGYLFTGAWTITVGIALVNHHGMSNILGILAIVIGILLILCSFEFVGSHEQNGWKLAATMTPFVYIAWSLLLVAVGVVTLIPGAFS